MAAWLYARNQSLGVLPSLYLPLIPLSPATTNPRCTITASAISDPSRTSTEPAEPLKGDREEATLAYTYSSPTGSSTEDTSDPTRGQRILEMLHLESSVLSSTEMERLQEFLLQHEYVFALDNSEVGATDLVAHSIDTGKYPPIRQPVRRTPFSLRRKVDEMVKEMIDQGVVRPAHSP